MPVCVDSDVQVYCDFVITLTPIMRTACPGSGYTMCDLCFASSKKKVFASSGTILWDVGLMLGRRVLCVTVIQSSNKMCASTGANAVWLYMHNSSSPENPQ